MTPGNLEPLTTKFWNNVNEGKLVRPFCAKCETSFFSPQVLCPVCQSENWEFKESSGNGTIYSFTIVHRPPETDFPNPYIIIDVEMEEGWRMYSRLIDCDPLSVQIDQSVKVVFREFQGRVLPFFQLREC